MRVSVDSVAATSHYFMREFRLAESSMVFFFWAAFSFVPGHSAGIIQQICIERFAKLSSYQPDFR